MWDKVEQVVVFFKNSKMTDEEKKELDNIKESPTYREVILLRVIEKQQKEIEELKEMNERQQQRIKLVERK